MIADSPSETPDMPTGVGDHVASWLAYAGITKERAQKVIGKNCGCSKRQQKLNELGRRYLGIGTPPPPSAGPTG